MENAMTRNMLIIIAGLAFAPSAASARLGDANMVLRGQIQALQAAGFSGMMEVEIPRAPTASVFPVSAQSDETPDVLAALRHAAKVDRELIGETVRALGFGYSGEDFPVKGIATPKDQAIVRFFSVTEFRGTAEIIIEEIRSVAGRKELRSYLISTTGTLGAAAVTRKVDGRFVTEKIPVSEAQAGCRDLLDFWTRYYRENLKKP